MSRAILMGIMLCTVFTAGFAQEVYRWVDDDGVVHYSDRPHTDAERVPLLKSPEPARRPQTRGGSEGNERGLAPPEMPFSYASLDILSPSQGETFWNIGGQLEVVLSVQPELQPGHSFRLYLDEQWLEDLPTRSDRLRLSEVYRGAHTLRVAVVDRNGLEQIQSQIVSIMVRQTSLISPATGGGN